MRSALQQRRHSAGADQPEELLAAVEQCLRLLGDGHAQLREAQQESAALRSEFVNLNQRLTAMERSILFRALRALGLQSRSRRPEPAQQASRRAAYAPSVAIEPRSSAH